MGALTQTDIGAQVKKMNALFQPDGKCSALADKKSMLWLVERLRVQTNLTQEAADREGMAEDVNQVQWALDMAHWRERLAGYDEALAEASVPSGIASCEELYPTVVGPLLDGRFEGALNTSGIMDPSVHSFPDLSFPFMLGNMVLVYEEFQSQWFSALLKAFYDSAVSLKREAERTLKAAAPNVLAIGIGIGIGAWGLTRVIEATRKGR